MDEQRTALGDAMKSGAGEEEKNQGEAYVFGISNYIVRYYLQRWEDRERVSLREKDRGVLFSHVKFKLSIIYLFNKYLLSIYQPLLWTLEISKADKMICPFRVYIKNISK